MVEQAGGSGIDGQGEQQKRGHRTSPPEICSSHGITNLVALCSSFCAGRDTLDERNRPKEDSRAMPMYQPPDNQPAIERKQAPAAAEEDAVLKAVREAVKKNPESAAAGQLREETRGAVKPRLGSYGSAFFSWFGGSYL